MNWTQDPTFLAMGNPSQLQSYKQDQQKLLSDPQQMNSYSYGRDNPVINKDPLVFGHLNLVESIRFRFGDYLLRAAFTLTKMELITITVRGLRQD